MDPLSRHVAAAATHTAASVADPLSSPPDPLSAAAAGRDSAGMKTPDGGGGKGPGRAGALVGEAEADDDDAQGVAALVPWSSRKTQIVQNFTTTGTIQMPSFVSVEVAKAGRCVRVCE